MALLITWSRDYRPTKLTLRLNPTHFCCVKNNLVSIWRFARTPSDVDGSNKMGFRDKTKSPRCEDFNLVAATGIEPDSLLLRKNASIFTAAKQGKH